MRTGTLLVLGGIAAGGLYLFTKAQAGTKLTVDASGIKNVKLSLAAVTMDIQLTVTNTTAQNLKLNGVGGNIILNQQIIGSCLSGQVYNIGRFATTNILIPTRIPLLNGIYIGQELLEMFSAGITVAFDGVAKSLGFNIPITTVIKVKF